MGIGAKYDGGRAWNQWAEGAESSQITDVYGEADLEVQTKPLLGFIPDELLPALCVFGAALPFGSVHVGPSAILSICLPLFCLLMVRKTQVRQTPSGQMLSSSQGPREYLSVNTLYYISTLLLLAGYVGIQSVTVNILSAHPLESVLSTSLFAPFISDFLQPLILFLSIVIITTAALHTNSHVQYEKRFSRAISGLVIVTLAISCIALVHWFADNGKLFWTFSPTYEFVSPRARWPLVNSNHLGFLLLPGFLLSFERMLSTISSSVSLIRDRLDTKRKKSQVSFIHVINSPQVQKMLRTFLIQSVSTLIIATALFAAISRAVSAAAMLGCLSLIIRMQLAKPERGTRERTKARKKPRSSHAKNQVHIVKAVVIAVGGGALFLSMILFIYGLGQGQERYLNRMAFGLLHTHEDMRWQLFSDSLSLLSFWGIGVSQWAVQYPTVASIGLAGYSPLYLHSDPLQFIIEFGVPGSLLCAMSFLLVLKSLLSVAGAKHIERNAFFHQCQRQSVVLLIVFGILLIPLSMDFPLRIPANLICCGMLVGLALSLGTIGISTITKSDTSLSTKGAVSRNN